MKRGLALLIGFAVFLAASSYSFAGESSNRVVANAPGLHLSGVRIRPASTDNCVVSGFAPGVGYFNQGVGCSDVNVNYSNGTGVIKTTVTTSLGLTIAIDVNWNATSSEITQSVAIPNPSRTVTNNFKRASVSGTIGGLTIGTGTTGEISQRSVSP
jgi:hypothetical protein